VCTESRVEMHSSSDQSDNPIWQEIFSSGRDHRVFSDPPRKRMSYAGTRPSQASSSHQTAFLGLARKKGDIGRG
jgi:hypothetical protein